MLRPLAALLLLTSATLADTADGEALKAMTWDQIVDQARGGTVNWFMWGGSDTINAYVSGYVADRLKADYDITLNRVPITDAAEIVNLVLSEKEAGVTDAVPERPSCVSPIVGVTDTTLPARTLRRPFRSNAPTPPADTTGMLTE